MSKTNEVADSHSLPLNSIRVFVEVARQRSFSRAALVLGITQGGISRHVAALEKHLGHSLFLRSSSAVELTEVGRLYFDNVQESMASIEMVTRQLARHHAVPSRLVVRTSLPTLAMTMLIPALPQFAQESAVQVDIMTSLSPPGPTDFYDVLISRDLVIENAEHWLLSTEELVCVAAPRTLKEYAQSSMGERPFIVAKSRPDALTTWVQQQGLESTRMQVVSSFEHYFLAIPAALAGMGFLVIPYVLVAEHVRQGHLALLPTHPVRTSACYAAFLNPHSASPEVARTFCRWLKTVFREV